MANVIATRSEQIQQAIDEVYQLGITSADLDYSGILVKAGANAKSIQIAKRTLEGLGDYARVNGGTGYPEGDVTLEFETHTFTQDRGKQMKVDYQDELESGNNAVGVNGQEEVGNLYAAQMTNINAQFEREKVIPEIDAYTYATLAAEAANTAQADLDATTIKAAVDLAIEQMDDDEVPEEGRILYMSNEVHKFFKNSNFFSYDLQSREVNNKTIETRVESYDGIKVVKVPRSRFYSAITISATDGYAKDGAGFDLNFLLVHPSAVARITKQDEARMFAPNQNLVNVMGAIGVWQQSNSFVHQYRRYYDVFVFDNKVDGIYAHLKTT